MIKALLFLALFGFQAAAADSSSANSPRATVTRIYTLNRISLDQFGNPAISSETLKRAQRNGLKFTDLPSIGSGLVKAGNDEFFAITDRGPNGTVGKGDQARRTFPLPEFCPTIVRAKLSGDSIRLTDFIPLHDSRGKLLTGLSNLDSEERLYETADSKQPLPLDPNGVDPEAIRLLPDGRFLISEEYSPSVLVVSPKGEVLVRYTPASKTLTGAAYPVKPILPAVFGLRRLNKGFESLAVSSDGRFAYVLLQGPMGDTEKGRFANSRIVRALKLDVSDPLNAKVVGEYLAPASPAATYTPTTKQENVHWSEADWIAPDKLLVLERARGESRLLLVDLGKATNILKNARESTLELEETRTDLSALGIQTASVKEIFSSRDAKEIDSDKMEGVAVLSPTEIALSNDNDFGLGDNTNGEPSRIWILRLSEPLP